MEWIDVKDKMPPPYTAVLFVALNYEGARYIVEGMLWCGELVSNSFRQTPDFNWVTRCEPLLNVTHWAKIKWPGDIWEGCIVDDPVPALEVLP
jgi:hypothetical protein